MRSEELLREGKPEEALKALQDDVRKDPSNPKFRIYLFQLLSVLGDWDRALTHLNVSGELDPMALTMVQTYQETIACEIFRHEVFAGKKAPLIFGEPEQWIALLMQSLQLTAEGHLEQSQDLRNQAFEQVPSRPGWINGEAFEWIADADPRLGPVLEVVVQGRYYWMPFHQVREIQFDEPSDLRDMVWTPAQFLLENGGTTVGFIPTRYPGSHASEDPRVKMARMTDWVDMGSELYLGIGQRLFATDAGEYPILEVRALKLEGEEGEEPAAGNGEPGEAQPPTGEPEEEGSAG